MNKRDENGLAHGPGEYRTSGGLLYRANYVHGERHGLNEWVYDDGSLRSRRHYNYGKQIGLDQEWDSEGNLLAEFFHLKP
jgi:antitoxin component YwqK of YwqJK toxin-antitoxin module